MKKNFLLTLVLLLVALFTVQPTAAQAPVATPAEAITALLNRIGGSGAADRFEIVIDETLDDANGKDVFVITAQNGKPCIKGNNQLSVATGINWYLNHYAHINLTWNNLTTDLSQVTLPLPGSEEVHECNTTYRYDFNTCTFSYSMAFWTWDRWQKEIDWMALHGINAPLNLVGLDVLWRNVLKDEKIGYSDAEIAQYIAGPGFIAWFAMNNLEGWGGTIESQATGVFMQGNPEWWYTRQEKLCRDMLQRMRELGMQPVIPGFSGQVPNSMAGKTISGINSAHIINNGSWEGYTRPDIINPATDSYDYMAEIYYKHLEELMGVSEFYSIDPFHEGNSLPSPATNEGTYPGIMESLDEYYDNVSEDVKTKYNAPEKTKWIIQKWQALPQKEAFTAMANKGYGDRFIGLDLFADAPGKAEWDDDFFSDCDFIFCMLHNFGGRSGLHGRLETVMTNYFRALEKDDCMGIGATPEGTETNPILYDMLFELPWMTPGNHLTADEWVKNYSYSRYGVKSETAENALLYLKESVWDCPSDQQGTTEAVILARPAWTVDRVSTWVNATVYWDTQDVLLAADQLYSIKDLVTANGGQDGVANYNYDFIDVVRQAMVDYAAQLLPLIKTAHESGDNAEYTRLYQLYLQLMLDLDTMLSYDENFKLERWTSLARNIANEGDALGYTTTENDRNWLEWNARTQVTVWSNQDNGLHDYSNRCWAGLIKDFHYKRWEQFFTTNGGSFNNGWRSGFEYPWTVDFNDTYNLAGDYSKVVIPTDMTATEKAAQTFGNYFGRVKGVTKNYIFPMGVATNATKSDVIPEVYRDKTVELPLEIGKNVTISSVWIDLNNDGAASDKENLAVTDGNKVAIPADAAIGKTTAKVTYSDGTVITFNLALIEDITENRTVTAATADANMGAVAIEGTNELTITNMEAVKITATANTGYNFENWTDAQGNVVSNDNPYIYYGKEDASFTANFIQDKWGVVADNSYTSELGTINQYKSYVHNMTFAYYNREAETIYEATAAPASVFTTIPQIINVPQGASFDIYYDDGDGTGLQYCYFRAYIDLNADGDFDDEGELLKEVGTQGAENTAVCSNKINVLLPYDAPLGITHMRLRFDGAYSNSEKPADLGAKDGSNRPVYEIVLNITDKTDKAAHVTVKTNSDEWGTAEVWTDETPDNSTRTEWDVTKGVPFYIAAEKASEDVEFLGWYDHYGRLVTENLEHTMYAREDATYTAKFRRFLEIYGWQIEYRTEGKNVILTKVRKSGDHDLVIPETVEILGEQCTIIGFDNGLFANNKDLWTITLPATIESVSSNRVFNTSVNGGGDYPQVIELGGLTLKNNEVWEIRATYESDGVATFNEFGTPLLYAGSEGKGSELFWLSNVNSWSTCWHVRSPFSGLGDDYFKTHTNSKISTFVVAIENKGTGKAVVKVTNSDGEIKESTEFTYSLGELSAFSAKLPNGLDMTNFEVFKGNLPDPFEGCTNLLDITVTSGCDYYVADRKFYSPDGTMLHTLADEEKAEELSALCELIDLTEALIEEVAVSVNPTGKATALPLTTTANSDYYVSTNADQNIGGGNQDGGGIAALVDGRIEGENHYFHSRWGGTAVNAPHHIQIDLGDGNSINTFKFSYVAHNAPDPTTIVVSGSNDGTNFTPIETITKDVIAVSSTYTSKVFDSATAYRYLRFAVTASSRSGFNSSLGNYVCFGMKEFDLYMVTSTAEVAPKYKNLAGITNEETADLYDSMADALYYYNNGGTAAELQAAYDALKPLYDALNAKKDKLFNGVYNINFSGDPVFVAYAEANDLNGLTGGTIAGFRLFDGAVTHEGAADGNTGAQKDFHERVIANRAVADALFTIVPNADATGYILSAQGQYMQTTAVHGTWSIQAFDADKAKAGVYLFEAAESADIYKLRSNKEDGLQYVNDWGPVFGNNSASDTYARFSLTQVTEYTLNVPANGATTLCLPFNVVLPAGVTAYDLTEAQIIQKGSRYIYKLNNVVADEGETLAKNTPVIIKAAEGNHTFTITMSDENVNGSASGSVLRSGMVKTTIGTAKFNYTFANNVFSKVTSDTEIAANQCWMELAEDAGAQILDEAPEVGPFIFTTDESNPVLYNILINRDDEQGNDKVLQFDEESKKVAVKEKVENNSYQAWYFMEGTNGFRMIPYNGMGKVLSAESSNAEKETVSAQTIGDQTYYEWILTEPDNNGYYYIQVHDGGNTYFSNNGGVGFMMGFWTAKDEGSQFKFVPATFSNDNPRYYQLKDVTAAMDITKQAMDGDAPGCRKNGDKHYNSYTAAMEQINKGSDVAAAADCYTAYTTLRATREALGDMIMPTPGNVYRLKNHISKSAEEGHKNHYIANSNAKLSFPTEADDNTTLWICVEGADGKFQFISGVGSATLTWKNFGENAVDYEIRSGVEQGAVALAYGTDNLTLTNEENANGVLFGHIANNATEQDNTWSTDWYIEPVADDVKAFHSRSIAKGYNYATLYLPYAATVPDGISAYTATVSNVEEEATRRYVDLQEVENGIIPARTAVVLYREGEAPALQEYKFGYTTDEGTAAVDNIFDGRVMTSAVGGDKENYCYYLLFRGTKGEAFYWMLEEYNESLDSGNTHIKCEGNKAYMVLPKQQNNASSYSFRFPGETTGVEEITDNRVQSTGVYDLQGRKVENPGKGLYIINGKKSFIK